MTSALKFKLFRRISDDMKGSVLFDIKKRQSVRVAAVLNIKRFFINSQDKEP